MNHKTNSLISPTYYFRLRRSTYPATARTAATSTCSAVSVPHRDDAAPIAVALAAALVDFSPVEYSDAKDDACAVVAAPDPGGDILNDGGAAVPREVRGGGHDVNEAI